MAPRFIGSRSRSRSHSRSCCRSRTTIRDFHMLRALPRLSSSSSRLFAIVAPALRYFRTKHVYALAPFSNLPLVMRGLGVCVYVCECVGVTNPTRHNKRQKAQRGEKKKTSNTQRINLIGQECVHKLIQRATRCLSLSLGSFELSVARSV